LRGPFELLSERIVKAQVEPGQFGWIYRRHVGAPPYAEQAPEVVQPALICRAA
jgi:hypothetical protein